MTQAVEADRVSLQEQADGARQRLLQAIDQLDTRTKNLAREAVEVTRVSGWGIAGAIALWAGVAWLTRDRQRERRQTAALVRIPARRPSFAKRTALRVLRSGAAIAGFIATRAWAYRWLEQHRNRQAEPPEAPHLRQLGNGAQPVLLAEHAQHAEARGTTDA